MEEYADIYYVDARNAVTDHRRPQPGRPMFVTPPPSRTPVVVPPGARPPVYGGQVPVVYQPPVAPMAPVAPMYPAQTPLSSLFQRLTTGQIVEMIAQVFAALQPLPAAPNATDNSRDNIDNLITYQSALAQHAKRDEQVRTVGAIIGKLV